MSNISLVTFMNLIIITIIVLVLSNFTKSEEIVTTEIPISTTVTFYTNKSSKNQTSDLKRSQIISHWLDSIITNVWKWLITNDDVVVGDGQDASRTIFEGNGEVTESRTFGKIKRLQFALLPIMFKFGVLSTLVSALVFLALKTIFLLKALFIVNLAVVFGKFFAWKTELTKSHSSGGGGGGGWGPPSMWSPPAWPSVHSYAHSPPAVIHSAPIIEASHPPSDGNKEIHVHVHTNKEEKEEHHSWDSHPHFYHSDNNHHEVYHDIHGAPSNKHSSYATNGPRERRNNALNDDKTRNLITKQSASNDYPRLLSSSSTSSSGSSSGSNSQKQVEIKSVQPKLNIQKPVYEVQSQKTVNSGETKINLSQKLVRPSSSSPSSARKQRKRMSPIKQRLIPLPFKPQGMLTHNSNKAKINPKVF